MKTFKKSLLVCDAKMIPLSQTGKPLHSEGLSIMEEIWKDIDGYEGLYQVSSLSRIKSLKRMVKSKHGDRINKEKIRTIYKNARGYVEVQLSRNSKTRNVSLHRIIAIAFIPNPENKKCINHINGIKTDNRLNNLEWVTHHENMKHAYDMGLKKRTPLGANPRARKVLNKETGAIYGSIKEAYKFSGLTYGYFRNRLNGKFKNNTKYILID